MDSAVENGEVCAVCRRALEPAAVYCRFHTDGSSLSFCSPRCAESHLLGPSRSGAGARNLIAELVAQRRWFWGPPLGPAAEPAESERPTQPIIDSTVASGPELAAGRLVCP